MQALTVQEMNIDAGRFWGIAGGAFGGGLAGACAANEVIGAFELAAGPAGWALFGLTTLGMLGGALMVKYA